MVRQEMMGAWARAGGVGGLGGLSRRCAHKPRLDEAEGGVRSGWAGRFEGSRAITIFFLGCQALTPGRWLPLQVRLPAAQGASWGPPAPVPWLSSMGQPTRTQGSAVTSALPAPPPAPALATVLG